MKLVLPALLLFFSAFTAQAFNPVTVDPERPYDIIKMEGEPYVEQEYLGNLADYPEMFEMRSEEAFDIKVRLKQLKTDTLIPFNLIVIRDDGAGRGVTEMARLNQPTNDWQEVKESGLAMTFAESRTISISAPAGTYRVEVSTPDNIGDYMLIVGEDSTKAGYFETLGNIRETQSHFGYSIFRMTLSPHIYYPLGIILVLFGFYFIRTRHKRLEHAT